MATKRITATPQRTDFDFDDFLAAGYRVRQAPPVQEQAPPEPEKRTWGQAIGDTAVQLAEGVNTTLGAIPSIVAPDGSMAGFFRDNADYWRDKQSDVLKKRIAATDQRIQEAGKEGVMSQIGTAVSEYWDDPAQAARLVATNLPSMAATLGTGALAGAAAKGVAAARGVGAAGEAALAAQYGTRTAMATNAALNAGGARGEAYEDLKRAALAQGMSSEQAEQAALDGSIVPGVVGGVAGAVSGKLGLEKALLGQPGVGAGTALRRAAGSFGAELAGEQIEEVAPKLTTNYEAGKIDPARSLTDDLGRTIVETAIGAGPGAIVAGGVEGMSAPAQDAADTIRAAEDAPESAPTLALPAPERGVIQVGSDGTARTPAYQAPGYVGDVTDVEPRAVNPVREQVAAAAERGGTLSRAALMAIDTGLSDTMRPSPEQGPPQISLEEADARDRAAYEQFFASADSDPVVGRYFENDDDIPDFDAASNASEEDFLRALGATDEDIQDAIATASQPAIPQSRLANDVGPQANEPAGPREAAGGNQAAPRQGQVTLRQPENFTGTPTATISQQGVTARPGPEFGPQYALAQVRPNQKREAAAEGMVTPAPTDILNPAGEPFKTRMAADRAAKKTPGAVVPVEGGFVVRPQEPVNVQDVPQAPEVPQAAPAVIQPSQAQEAVGTQPAGPAAGVPAEGAGAVEAAGVERSKLLASLDQTGATREMVLDAQLKDAQYRLAQITATTGILPADRASRLSAINQEIADLNAVRDQARALDERDRREGNTRSMLQGARQELDAAVRAGAVTPDAAQSIAADAKKTGNAADASDAIFAAVDSPTTGVARESQASQTQQASAQAGDADAIAALIQQSISENTIKANEKIARKQVANGYLTQEQADADLQRIRDGFANTKPNQWAQSLAKAIAEKDPRPLVGAWAKEGQGTYGVEGSMAGFEKATGIKLRGLNSAARAKAIFDWAGWTEDQVAADVAQRRKLKAESDAAREAKSQAEYDDRITERATKELVLIKDTQQKLPIKEYVDGLISQGYNTILSSKRGAITKTYLANERGEGYPLPVGVMRDYAQAAVRRAAAPNSGMEPANSVVEAPAQETTHNGTRIYPTKIKVGDEVKSMWAVESPDNQRRRAAGERTIGGDSLHDTIEQAQAAAEREAKRDAEQQEAKAEQDAADKARLDAEEARKAANRPKTVVERRKDAILDGPSKIGQGTKRAVITTAVDNGYAIEAKMVYDHAAKKRDQEAVDRASRAGYILGVSNENLPLVKAGNEAKARLKEGKYEKPEYRVYQGSDTKAPFREITKTEYDYAQELKAQRAAAPQAEIPPASATHTDPGQAPEVVTPAVVEQSVQKAARNEDTKPSEMRKWLVAEIDKELLQASDRADYDEAVKRLGEKDAISGYTGNGPLGKNSETGFITFDVPGDGKYKVRNSVRGLLEFRKNVMASQGFKDSGQKRAKPEQNDGVQGGSGGNMAAITNMVEEGDFEAARDYAEAVGIKLEDVKVPRGDMKPAWEKFLKDGTLPPAPDTRPQPAPKTAAQLDEEKRQAAEAEAKKPKDTGWNMAGTGYGGKRYIGRNITLDDGREVVARVYENAGTYEEAEVKVDGVRKFTITDRDNAQGKADAFIKTLTSKDGDASAPVAEPPAPAGRTYLAVPFSEKDYAKRAGAKWDEGKKLWYADPVGGDGAAAGEININLKQYVPQDSTKDDRYNYYGDKALATAVALNASARDGVQYDTIKRKHPDGIMMWSVVKAGEQTQAAPAAQPAIPAGYKPAGEPFYRGGKQIQGYAPFAPGERVTMKESAGQSGVVESLTSPDDAGVFSGAMVKFDNGSTQIVKFEKLDAEEKAAPAAQPEAPKLTPAEAKSLMAWEDLGQKDGVKTHALTFYESQADKDAKRGRMIVAKVTKGDRSATAWMVDGDDKTFGMLAQAKKLAEEVGMARAVADGFVESPFAKYEAEARAYGYEITADGKLSKNGRVLSPVLKESGGRLRIESPDGNLLFSGKQSGESLGQFVSKFWGAEKKADGFVEQGAPALANDRNAFTLQRLNRETGQMEPVTFERGEYVRYTVGGKDQFGDIDGISQARKEFSVDGLWYPFGFAYKAERPAAPKADTVPLSSVIDKVNAKNGQGLTDADRVPEQKPASKTPTVDHHNATMAAVREGKATPEQFQSSFEQVVSNKDAIVAELDTMTKVQLLREGGPLVQMRYANEKKAEVVDAVYRQIVGEYALGESVTYSMGKGAYEAAVRKMVEATDADKLARYVTDRKAAVEEMQARRAAKAAAIENPQTLADFRELLNAKIREGMTRKEAFLTLTPQQRIQYDTLEAESTREARENRKRAQKTEVRAAGQTTAGEIVATKHTRDGYDLFVVKLADRLSKEDYSTVLASAKKLGGWYSAFRGNGAIPGFQFKDKANAEAFLALAGGDTAAAQEQVAQRRDAFEDDRSQTAVERLRAMADKLEEGAAEVEGQQRKTNTARRARFASAAMASAAADKAKAKTMRNIARAIEGGEAKFLDAVRTKSQVDMLTGIVDTAKGNELRAKYPSYADQEKRKGEPPTAETADFADFPSYSAFRSDLATLGRQMLEVDGTKKLGQRLMSVADDVTDAYLEFAKANIQQVSQFGRGDALAEFASKDEAERAIKRSGLTGKAIVLPIKRGQNRVILSPSEAIGRGLWQGDGDKRITLTAEFGAELVEAIGRRGNKQNQLSVPWQFQNAYDRRKALSRIGIETPSEFRAALREFISLKEQAIANRTRELELQMVGRKADGLDFFPTSAEVADQMIEAADLTPDMAVLEPSAGMGHLADRIREAGAEPDVIEISADRRELLEEKGYTTQAVDDFLDLKPREFYTFGDTFRAPDGAEGIMRGANGNRVRLVNQAGDMVGAGYYDRADLTGVAHNGTASGYDRIIMNPPFSNRRDAEHVRHAYSLLKPGGRIVAIMGEGVFFGQDKKAQDFREWLESVGGTSEKLPEGSFMDPSLPVNTSVNARMVVIDKAKGVALFATASAPVAPGQGITLQAAQQATDKVLDGLGMRGVVVPKVFRNTAAAGISDPGSVMPTGGTSNGEVYLFTDNIHDEADAFKVVFHELFHLGLSQSVKPQEYIQTMLQFLRDPLVRKYANEWKQSKDGRSRLGTLPLNNWHALAVEEALAVIGENLNTDGKGIGTKEMQGWVRRTIAWLADLAQSWKMPAVARKLRGMTYTQAEAFVQETMLKGRTGAPVLLPDTRFRSAADTAQAVGNAIKSVTVTNIKQRAGFKLTDYLGIGLQALGRRQIVDIYGDMLPLGEYNRLVQQMEADKNEGGAEADQLVTRWAKLEDEGKLADLMHDATLAQIDPAEDFVEGDDKGKYLELQRKYNLLSDGAKKVYADTRDAYKAHHAKVRSAIKERIERSEIKGERKAALLKQMDDEFFKAVKGVYFPLARFGQYAVTVRGPDGKVESVSRAETKAEAEALRNNLLAAFPRDKGFTVGRVMLSKDFIADRDAVGRGFMTELYQVLDKQDMDAAQRAELEDTLGQLYLSSLPDLSWAKHGIHRKGTPGFSQDARRAFAQNMFHGARYLAKLRYSDLMQDELTAMQRHVDDWREVEDFDQNSAQRVVTEMYHRHESLMNPKSNPLSTALTSLGFVFHLGLSPASAMVNLSQTALVAYPIMGAKWGFGKASAALLKASAEAAKGKNDITGSLNADELAAYNEAVRAGTIDVTMAHDLAGIAQGEDAGVMWKIRPVMRYASFLFHHAERFNRQVTFVAAYRLAREAGADHKAAFEQATKATYDGHFDYGAANRPRIMQGNVAKVLLLFKQYGQNMVYTLARNAQQAIKGESPEVRAQARKALGGLLATHAAAAGVLGLPMVTTLLAAASMIGGDDDEPWDAKVALQNLLADTLGQKPAEVLAHGLSRLTPWDISGRVGLDKLIFPDVQEGLEGQRLGEAAMAAALGPVAGIGINVLKGLQDMSQGQYARGLEAMMPAALRGPIKAIRYESEGVQDKTGVVIKDDVSLAGVAGQFLGFSPSEVRNATEGKSAVIQQDRALGERRQELLTKAARATMAKDAEARAEAMKEIERFNQKNPTRRITPLNVLQSVRNRQKRIDQAEGGVYLPKNRRDAMEAGRFAVAE